MSEKDKLVTQLLKLSDFSETPGGRYKKEGPFSGEEYRETVLIPAVKKGHVTISISGIAGASASFLEEAFGGIVRKFGPEIADQVNVLLDTENSGYAEKITTFMREAADRSRASKKPA
jgi:hypothetical protein